MEKIKAKDIFKQLGADLIGKDSYRGVTLTYSWLANQFGHFSLGFIPTVILHNLTHFKNQNCSAIIVSLFWLFFESLNFSLPLLFNTPSRSKVLPFLSKQKYIFKPDYCNVGFDTLTDVVFFGLGAFVANIVFNYTKTNLLIFLGLFAILIYPSHYWYITKMYIQNAVYPYQLRLSQIDNDKITTLGVKNVEKYKKNCLESTGNNFLIYGPDYSGKSSLAVAIATELSIKHKVCWFTTGMKILGKFSEELDATQGTENLWNWKVADVLIIDDINPGGLINELITTEIFKKSVDSGKNEKEIS